MIRCKKIAFAGVILLSLFKLSATAQQSSILIETTGLGKFGAEMPFWFTHNQLGKYQQQVGYQSLSEIDYVGNYQLGKNYNLQLGADAAIGYDRLDNHPMIVQAYASFSGKFLNLTVGSKANDVLFDGLSSSNGDILQSNNYRPVPKIGLGTKDYTTIPLLKSILKDKFSFHFVYEEGYLYDDRYIEDAMLHHDHLYIRYQLSDKFRITAGVNRYAFWGGTNRDGSSRPHSFEDYLRTVLGREGNADFTESEQLNSAGNNVGAYLLSVEKSFTNWDLEFRATHPFEDHSGMEFANWRDNLWTFFIKRKEPGRFLEAVLFEFMYTKHQSGSRHQVTGPVEERMRGVDNYFNHSVYRSGYSFMGYSMGTPLFTPLGNETANGFGFANNRVVAYHLGAKGQLFHERLQWKGLLTYTRNFGTYHRPFNHHLNQWYSMAEISWLFPQYDFQIAGLAGADYGDLNGDKLGFGLSLRKQF